MTMTLNETGTFLRAGEGKRYWVLGDHVSLMTPQGIESGQFALAETICAPHGGPPPHLHRNEDEAFYIVEGNFEFLLGDRIISARPGTFVFAPRNKIHQYRNTGPGKGVFVAWAQPGHFGKFLEEFGTPADGIVDPPAVDRHTIDKLNYLCDQYGIEMHPQAQAKGFEWPAENPKAYWVLGDRVKLLCTGAQTDGSLCVTEVTSLPGGGPPAHFHYEQDEIFYIVDGTFEFLLGDHTMNCGRGSVIHVPRLTPHYIRNVGPSTGRFLSFHTPAGIENFLTECGTLEGSGRLTTLRDPRWIMRTAAKHGIELVG